jgi:hypothetical protein
VAGYPFWQQPEQRRDQADDNSEEDFRRRVEFMHRHLAGLCFFFLKPDLIPGGETTVYRYGERECYYQTVRWQKPAGSG